MKTALLFFSLFMSGLLLFEFNTTTALVTLFLAVLFILSGITNYFSPVMSIYLYVLIALTGILASIAQATHLNIWGFCFVCAFFSYFGETNTSKMKRHARVEAFKSAWQNNSSNGIDLRKYSVLKRNSSE